MATEYPYRGEGKDPWPDPEFGPYGLFTHWAEIDGRLQCVGLSLSSVHLRVDTSAGNVIPFLDQVVPVGSSQLRRPGWHEAMERFRQAFALTALTAGLSNREHDRISSALIAAGIDSDAAAYGDWLAYMTPEERAAAMDIKVETAPRPSRRRGGRPSQFSEEQWAERADVYRSAVENHLAPNKELARAFGVSVERARNWAAAMRRRGYDLPMPSRRRPPNASKES